MPLLTELQFSIDGALPQSWIANYYQEKITYLCQITVYSIPESDILFSQRPSFTDKLQIQSSAI